VNRGELVAELLELLAGLLRKRRIEEVRAALLELDAKWPAPIGEADVDAAVADGLRRSGR
jgi:hypothetical protein